MWHKTAMLSLSGKKLDVNMGLLEFRKKEVKFQSKSQYFNRGETIQCLNPTIDGGRRSVWSWVMTRIVSPSDLAASACVGTLTSTVSEACANAFEALEALFSDLIYQSGMVRISSLVTIGAGTPFPDPTEEGNLASRGLDHPSGTPAPWHM